MPQLCKSSDSCGIAILAYDGDAATTRERQWSPPNPLFATPTHSLIDHAILDCSRPGGDCLGSHRCDCQPDRAGATVTGLTQTNAKGNAVNVFRGIPYADAPIGDKRWKQTKLKPLSGAVDATAFGSVCFAAPGRLDPTFGQFPFSEDCLFLNIFAPAGATASSKLPVMVWIHGGAFVAGSSSSFDGSNLANDELVVVTINHRLGVFGFLSNDEILADGDGANFAFRDQEIAFQWVRKHIQHFGGNPNQITGIGESAGAIAIAMHMISGDGNQELFDKGIMESGVYTATSAVRTVAQQADFMATLAAGAGCTTAPGGVMDCLRKANASTIMAAGGSLGWRPTVDGVFLKDVPIKRVLADKVSRVPAIVGTNTDEGWLFTTAYPNASQFDTFRRTLFPLWNDAEYASVTALYPIDAFPTPQHRVAQIFGDVTFVCPGEVLSQQLATHPTTPNFRYRFNQTKLTNGIPLALHIAEVDYVFNNVDSLATDEGTKSLVEAMQKSWTNFAKTGNPNGVGYGLATQSTSGSGFWPAFSGRGGEQIVLQTNITAESVGAYIPSHEERCALWRAVDLRVVSEVSFFKK